MYSNYFYSPYLYHHGIKGQKWGVRRYQNPDGSLTGVGRNRYGTGLARRMGTRIGGIARRSVAPFGYAKKAKGFGNKASALLFHDKSKLLSEDRARDQEKLVQQSKTGLWKSIHDTRRNNNIYLSQYHQKMRNKSNGKKVLEYVVPIELLAKTPYERVSKRTTVRGEAFVSNMLQVGMVPSVAIDVGHQVTKKITGKNKYDMTRFKGYSKQDQYTRKDFIDAKENNKTKSSKK